MRFHGQPVVIRLDHDGFEVDADGDVPLLVPGILPLTMRAPARFRPSDDGWQEVRP